MTIRLLSLLALLMFSIGCATDPSPRGDAITRGSGHFKVTKLPKFPIGRTGTHEFVVADLQERAYPYNLRYHTELPTSEYLFNPAFADAVIRVDILDFETRKVLASKTVYPTSWRQSKSDAYDQYFWPPGKPTIPFKKQYRVRATVLEPSSRKWDEGQILLR